MEQINQIPVLLDISDLLIVVKKIDKNGHFSRDKKELLRQCKHNNVFQQKVMHPLLIHRELMIHNFYFHLYFV